MAPRRTGLNVTCRDEDEDDGDKGDVREYKFAAVGEGVGNSLTMISETEETKGGEHAVATILLLSSGLLHLNGDKDIMQ
jgi:hypothetical protein